MKMEKRWQERKLALEEAREEREREKNLEDFFSSVGSNRQIKTRGTRGTAASLRD